jgi:carbon-monoxide dehydrogenase medium subunit
LKPAPFKYLVPDSLDSATAVLGEYGFEAKILAGGQSLVPAMNFRLVQPGVIVDINRLQDLEYIRPAAGGGLSIGGLTRQRQLERDALIRERAPLIAETMPFIAHPQIRNRGTIGGSLAHADPAAELPALMVILEARFRLRSARGERWMGASQCFQGIFTTLLEPDEILVEIELRPLPPATGYAFVEFARRHGDYALLGVAARLTLGPDGRIAAAQLVYLNAGEVPVSAYAAGASLLGRAPDAAAFREAASIAVESEIHPIGNIHASTAYLRHLGHVLTARALQSAADRAVQRA